MIEYIQMNEKKVLLLLILGMFIFVIGFSLLMNKAFTPEYIIELSTNNCPKSSDFNNRFEKLYNKFGNGKEVPNIFEKGSTVDWDKINENLDYLIGE